MANRISRGSSHGSSKTRRSARDEARRPACVTTGIRRLPLIHSTAAPTAAATPTAAPRPGEETRGNWVTP